MFSRTDRSLVSQWWWTVDRWMLGYILVLIGIGVILNLAASPAVAERIGVGTFYFVKRHMVFLPLALVLMVGLSMMSIERLKRIATLGFFGCLGLLVLTLMIGPEIKGATRWLNFGPFSLQPSEIMKPCFAVMTAYFFTKRFETPNFPGYLIALLAYTMIIGLIMLQPDLGMSVVISGVFWAQFFLAGLPYGVVIAMVLLGLVGIVMAYMIFDHVQKRIDLFLDPSSGDSFQVERSLNAFSEGGLFGVGPGEGTVKQVIPDVHADFVFAVAGEEFGFFMCLAIVALFFMIIVTGLSRVLQNKDMFVLLAVSGILTQFGIQALINMGSTLSIIPTKGMTLPFISYGGSSIIALGIGMGFVLGLTRRHQRSRR